MGESYAVWSFLLSCVAGGGWQKSAGLGACGIVQGGGRVRHRDMPSA